MQFMMLLYSCFCQRLWIRSIFDSTAQFLHSPSRKPKWVRWKHKNEFVFQNPPGPLKASEWLWKSHWREMTCSKNSGAGWLGMLVLKMNPVFIGQEPRTWFLEGYVYTLFSIRPLCCCHWFWWEMLKHVLWKNFGFKGPTGLQQDKL